MSRALNKQMLFDDECDFLVFLSILSQAKKEYLKQAESTVMVNVIKLINMGIPLMQLSRVTGYCYSKIQRLGIGKA